LSSKRTGSSSKYENEQRYEASGRGYQDSSTTYDQQGDYGASQGGAYQSSSYGSPSYTYKPPSDPRASANYDDRETQGWKQDSAADEPPTEGLSSLSIDGSKLPLSGPAPLDVTHISSSLPPVIIEDSNAPDQWAPSAAANDQGMLSTSYKGKGHEVATRWQSHKLRGVQGDRRIAPIRDPSQLDPLYKVRNLDYKDFFKPGKVFSTLWTTPFSGTTNQSIATNDSESQFISNVTYIIFGEKVHSKIRRFVVARQAKDKLSCTCIPITTYSKQGGGKSGIYLDDHGLIFSSKKLPRDLDGIKKKPLKVILSPDGEELFNPSLVDYGRVYTVDCNVKVKEVGDVDHDSKKYLKKYFLNTFKDPDGLDEKPEPQTPQARDGALAGVGGAGSIPDQSYESPPTSTGFGSSSFYPSSSVPHQIPSYPPLGSGSTSSTVAYSQELPSSYTAGADYGSRLGPSQPIKVSSINYSQARSYDPNPSARSTYPSDPRYVPSNSYMSSSPSTSTNPAPPTGYRDPHISSTSQWFPAAGTIPHNHIDSRPYSGSNPPPAGNYSGSTYGRSYGPSPSASTGAYQSSAYGPADNQPMSYHPGRISSSSGGQAHYDDRDIDLDDRPPYEQPQRTTRPLEKHRRGSNRP